MKAMWKNAVLAESNQTVVVEGNHYFPPEAVNRQYLRPSDTHTTCPWKGLASYYHINVKGEINKRTRRGTILIPKMVLKISRTILPSGRVWK